VLAASTGEISWVETPAGLAAYLPVEASSDQLVRAGAAIHAKRCELASQSVVTAWEASSNLPVRPGFQALGSISFKV
jgi:hypothetical protein